MEAIQTLKAWVDEARAIVFFGGAGVSTESGLKDFRSVDGLYHEKFDYPPEEILSHSFFLRDPAYFYRFYREKMLALDAEPNAAHRTLARWEREGKLLAVVTQNIDGLHQKAGSRRVYELHGSVYRNHCMQCGKAFGPEYVRDHTPLPVCDACGGLVKPDVVLYEEALDDGCIRGAVEAIARADLLIVGGTSLTVYPAAGLLRYYGGSRLAILNRDATPMDDRAGLVIREPIARVLAQMP